MIVESDRSLLPGSQILQDDNGTGYPAIELLSGTSNPELVEGVGQILGIKPNWPVRGRFPNGQMHIQIENPLAKRQVFIIQSTADDNDILELIFMLDAARRASAGEITTVIPYFGYAQSDRKTAPGEMIGAAILARIFEFLGAGRLVTMDPHYDQIPGVVSSPFDILYGSWSMIPVIKEDLRLDIDSGRLAVAAPDEGAGKRGRKWARMLGVAWAGSFPKDRDPETGKSEVSGGAGIKVNSEKILLVDDVWCSGGTIFGLLPALEKAGVGEIYAAVTHGFFAGDSLDKLSACSIKKVYVSNTIVHRPEVADNPKVAVVDAAPLVARAILDIFTGRRHAELFL